MLGPNSKRTLKDSAHKGYDKTLVIPYRGFPFFDALHRNVWALQSLCPPPKMHFLQAVRKKNGQEVAYREGQACQRCK